MQNIYKFPFVILFFAGQMSCFSEQLFGQDNRDVTDSRSRLVEAEQTQEHTSSDAREPVKTSQNLINGKLNPFGQAPRQTASSQRLAADEYQNHPEQGLFKGELGGKELIDKRNEFSKTYRNPDGTFSQTSSNLPMHYKDATGNWLTYTDKLKTNSAQNTVGLYQTDVPIETSTTTGEISFFASDNEVVSIGKQAKIEAYSTDGTPVFELNSKQTNEHSIDGNAISLSGVFPGVRKDINMATRVVKSEYVVNEPLQQFAEMESGYVAFTESIKLPKGWELRKDVRNELNETTKDSISLVLNGHDVFQGAILIVDNLGEVRWRLEMPRIYDSKPMVDILVDGESNINEAALRENAKHQFIASYGLRKVADGEYEYAVLLDAEWLNSESTVYPVTVDPTVTATNFSTAWVGNNPAWPCRTATTTGAPVGALITNVAVSYTYTTAWVYVIGCCGWYTGYQAQCSSWFDLLFESAVGTCANGNATMGNWNGGNPNQTWDLCMRKLTTNNWYVIADVSNYTVTVTYTDPCPATIDDGSITANGSTGSINICLGESVTIASVGGNTSSWCYWISSNGGVSWNIEAASRCNQGSYSYTPNTVGTWRFHKRHSDVCGYCWDAGRSCSCTNCTVDVVVQSPPTAPTTIEGEANGGSTNLCTGTAITLDAAGGGNGSGATYQWYAGTTCCSGSSLGSGSTLNITPPASGQTYHVRRVGNTACTAATGSVSHRIYSRPISDDITSVSGTNTLCEGESTTLTANGGALIHYPFTSNANDASGNGWNLTGSGGTFSADGITLTTSSSYQTAATNVLNTDVHTIAFKLRFNGAPDGSWRQIFRWADPNFGNRSPGVWRYPSTNQMHWRYELDGTTCCAPAGSSSGISEANVYTPGTFYDIVMVKNGATLSLYIDGTLYASGAVSDPKNGGLTPLVFGGANVTLRDFKVYAADLRWYTGSCTGTYVGSGPSLTVTPPAGNTTYYVRAEGECNTGTCRSRAVTVYDEPVAEAGPSRSTCSNAAYTLPAGASVTGSYTSYNWTYVVNSGTVTSVTNTTTLTPIITPSSAAGSVTLTLNVVGTSPCANADDSMTFTWSSAPTADAGSDQTQCGNTANFTFSGATASTPSTWAWSIVAGSGNGSLISGGATLTNWGFNPSTPSGTATIRLTVTGSGTCTGATATDDIVVSWIEPATLSLSSPIVSCNGDDPIDITGQTANGFFGDVSWTGGETDGSWSTGINGYYDDFSTNTSANYSMTSQANTSWNWSGGLLYSDATPGGNDYSYARYTGINVTNRDIVIEYDMMIDGTDWGGLEYRGIYCDINTSRTGWRDDIPVYNTAGLPAANTWHHIKMVIVDASPYPLSTLYIDGAVRFANEPIHRTVWPRADVGFVSSYYSPYRHYFNNFKVSEQASVFTYTPNTGVNQGTFTAYITANGIGQCASTDPTGNITVGWGTAPTATVGTPQTTCGTNAHTMTGATASGTFSSVGWSGGAANGAWSNTSTTDPAQWTFTPNAAYAATGGTFNATLTVTGGSGSSTACVGSDFTITRAITIDPLPAAEAGSDIEVCTGDDGIPMVGASANFISSFTWSTPANYGDWYQVSTVPAATFFPNSDSLDSEVIAVLTVMGTGTCSSESDSDTRTITWHTSPTISAVNATNVTDCNSDNGAIVITAEDDGYIEYSIDNGSTFGTSAVFSGLSDGSYNIVVKDDNDCITAYSSNPVVINPVPPIGVASITVTSNVICGGASTGEITISGISGGQPIYSYGLYGVSSDRWYDIGTNTNYVITGLSAGSYQVVVRDLFGCMTGVTNLTITENPPILVTNVAVVDVGGCGANGVGSVTITASGGIGSLSYTLISPAGSSTTNATGVFASLVAGSYQITVEDALGCTRSLGASINADWVPTAGNNINLCAGSGSVQLQGGYIGQYPQDCSATCSSGCGLPTVACNAAAVNTTDDWLSYVTVVHEGGTMANGSYSTTYTDFTSGSGSAMLMYRNGSYPITAQVRKDETNSSSSGWSQCVRVYVDWNRDGSFNDTPAYYDLGCSTANPSALASNITVPAGASLGDTRMRVVELYSTYGAACNPIGSSFGEVEDYKITVQGEELPCVPDISWSGGSLSSSSYTPTVTPSSNTTYTITIDDQQGCIQSATVDVSVSNMSVANVSEDVGCNGDDDGCITVNPTSGIGPYLLLPSVGNAQVWGGRMRTLTISSSAALTAFQISTDIAWIAPMRADFGDIRFFTANGTSIPYWMESYTLSGTATVWLKVPAIANGSTTVYMTFGNGSLTTQSDGDAVFEFFDDFNFDDSSKWTRGVVATTSNTDWSWFGGELIGGNTNRTLSSNTIFTGQYISESRVYETVTPNNGYMTNGFFGSTANSIGILSYGGNNNYIRSNGGWVNFNNNWNPRNTWVRDYIQGIGVGSFVRRTRESDNSIITSATYNLPLNSEYVRLGARYDTYYGDQNFTARWDWLFVRKYTATQPTVAIGGVVGPDNEFCGLPPNSYSVVVVDAADCSETENATITEPPVLTIDNIDITDTWCYDNTHGELDITVVGGTEISPPPEYLYNWAGPASFSSSSEDLTGLGAGIYNVTVADDNGCTASSSASVGTGTPINAPSFTWTGAIDNNWHDIGNWDCGLPDATSDVVIPSTSNDPHVFNGQGDCNTIDIETDNGAHLFVDPGGSLEVHQ